MTAMKKIIDHVHGAFNAKIGCDIKGYEKVMWQKRMDEMSDNEERFAPLQPCHLRKASSITE